MLLDQINRKLAAFQAQHAPKKPALKAVLPPRAQPKAKSASVDSPPTLAPVETAVTHTLASVVALPETSPIKANTVIVLREAPSCEEPKQNALAVEMATLKKMSEEQGTKTVGVALPIDLHAELTAFLKENKDVPGMPKSLKELALLCIHKGIAAAKNTATSPV